MLLSALPSRQQGPKCFGHSQLLFPGDQQGVALKVEQPVLEPMPFLDPGFFGRRLYTHYTTILSPLSPYLVAICCNSQTRFPCPRPADYFTYRTLNFIIVPSQQSVISFTEGIIDGLRFGLLLLFDTLWTWILCFIIYFCHPGPITGLDSGNMLHLVKVALR